MGSASAQRTSSGSAMVTALLANSVALVTCSPLITRLKTKTAMSALRLDNLADPAPSLKEIICDKAELDQLFARLNELMPEAVEIGRLRQDGLSDEAISKIIGIKRTTFLSRLKKAKKQLAAEFPNRF